MTGTLLTLGHGYCANVLAARLLAEGWRVIGATRSPEKAASMAGAGVEPLLWPAAQPAEALDRTTHVLLSAAPEERGDPVFLELADSLAARAGRLAWVGYLSTTGVYGDRSGAWIGEESPLEPTTLRGRLRLAAEADWVRLSERHGVPLHIFRLAGIYGPGRGPFEKVRNGTARRIIKPGQVFSRIHVDDIATVLAASIARPDPIRVYNVCDDEPAPPQDVIAHAATLLGLPPPPEVGFEDADLSPMARSFYAESKRVRNDRIKHELGVTLAYPDFRSGLEAVLAAEG